MAIIGNDENLWRASAAEAFSSAPLQQDAEADLVIIGGGFTGCAAAYFAARAGASVIVLEAETVGHGGSGRNVGLVNAGLWLPPDDVERALGMDAGRHLNEVLAGGPEQVFALIEEHAIQCEPQRNGTLHCAHSPVGMADLANRHRQLAARGAPVTLLDAAEARTRTGSDAVFGALHDARAGTINPLAYARGLARAATAAGASVYERSPVRAIERDGTGWRVATSAATVRAGALLCATNGYHQPLQGMATPTVVPVHFFQMATRPLSDNLARTILPGREGCWDTATVMSSFRLDAANRLIVGGIGALDHAGQGIHRAWLRRKLARLFPVAADMPLEHAWFGRIAMTGDHIPKVLTLGEQAYAVFGYSGRGISPGTVFGKALAGVLLGVEGALLPVPPVKAYAERFPGLKQGYYEMGAVLTHLTSR